MNTLTGEAAIIRQAASENWNPQMPLGHIHFNEHHGVYQHQCTPSRVECFLPQHIEWTDTQLAAWMRRLLDARARARLLVPKAKIELPALPRDSANPPTPITGRMFDRQWGPPLEETGA